MEIYAVIVQPPPPAAPFALGEVIQVDEYAHEIGGTNRVLSDYSLYVEFWNDPAKAAERGTLAVQLGGLDPAED